MSDEKKTAKPAKKKSEDKKVQDAAEKAKEQLIKKALKAVERKRIEYELAMKNYEALVPPPADGKDEGGEGEDEQGELEKLADTWPEGHGHLFNPANLSGAAKSIILSSGANIDPTQMEADIKDIVSAHLGGDENGDGYPDAILILKSDPADKRKWLFCSYLDGKCVMATDYENEPPVEDDDREPPTPRPGANGIMPAPAKK